MPAYSGDRMWLAVAANVIGRLKRLGMNRVCEPHWCQREGEWQGDEEKLESAPCRSEVPSCASQPALCITFRFAFGTRGA